MNEGSWYYSPDHRQLCQVIETQTLWSDTTCLVWLPGSDVKSWFVEIGSKANVEGSYV